MNGQLPSMKLEKTLVPSPYSLEGMGQVFTGQRGQMIEK